MDDFCQKLVNSGYSEDKIRRIVIAGIKRWEGRVKGKDSLEKRIRTKLLG